MISARLVDDGGETLLSMGMGYADVALSQIDLGFPDARESSTPLSGQDGAWDTTSLVGGRGITAEVTVHEPGTVGASQDVLRALMHPRRRMWLYVSRDDWAADRRIRVRGASLATANGRFPITAQLAWRAATPTLEDVTATSVTLNPVADSGGGLSLPTVFPLAFAPGLVPGATIVSVGGTADASPTVDVYGPCTDPLIRVVGSGELSFTGLTVRAGDYLHIDVADRSITLNNDAAQSQYHRLNFGASTWPTLPPGSAQVVFSPASAEAGCVAVVSWRSQWM